MSKRLLEDITADSHRAVSWDVWRQKESQALRILIVQICFLFWNHYIYQRRMKMDVAGVVFIISYKLEEELT